MIFLVDFENVHSAGLEGIDRLTDNDKIYIFYSEQANQITVSLHERLMQCPAEYRFIEVYTGRNALDFQLSSYLGYLIGTEPKAQYVILSNDAGFNPLIQFWNENHCYVFKKNNILSALSPKMHQPKEYLPAPADEIPTPETTLPTETPFLDFSSAFPADVSDTITPTDENYLSTPLEELQEPKPFSEISVAVENPSAEKAELKVEPKTKTKSNAKKKKTPAEQSAEAKAKNAADQQLAKELAAALPEYKDKLAQITKIVQSYKTKTGINNALVKAYKSETAGAIYKKIKPLLSGKK